MKPIQPPAALSPALPATSWHFVARNTADQVVEGWLWAAPDLETAARQVRQIYPDIAQLDLLSRGLPPDSIAGGPPLCGYCHTYHYGYQDHYLA